MTDGTKKRRPSAGRLGPLAAALLVPGLLVVAPARARAEEGGEDWDEPASEAEPAPTSEAEPAPTFGAEEAGGEAAAELEDERPARRGISPRWFWASLALGLGLGVGAGITGGYTLSLNQLYLEDRSDPLLRERGVTLQLATNVLIGVASGMALVAVLTAIFTDWSPRPRPEPEEEELEAALSPGLSPLGSLRAARRLPAVAWVR